LSLKASYARDRDLFGVFCFAVNAEVVLKGTNVDGVYDCDPRKNNNVILDHISYRDFVTKGLQATTMDLTAITFCEENCIPGDLWCILFLFLHCFITFYLTCEWNIAFLILKLKIVCLQLSFLICMSQEIFQGLSLENKLAL
jgi:hypothetical protein